MLKAAVAAFLIAFVLLYVAIEFTAALGVLMPTGVTFDLRSGVVVAVQPGSPAAAAGIRVADRADFTRGGWQLHLSLNRADIFAGQHTSIPLVRGGKAFTATMVGPPPAPPPSAWADFVNIASVILYAGLGAALYFMRRTTTSLVFFALTCGLALQINNLAPLRIAPPSWMPFAMFLGTISPTILDIYGLLYFGLLFSNDAPWVGTARRYVLLPTVILQAALYYYHFYGFTIWREPFNSYLVYSILQWLVFAAAATAITARVNRESNAARLRWVAVGLWLQAIVFAVFFIDQNRTAPSLQGNAFISYLFAWFQPGTFCIAYVLMRTRVIDVRLVGARTLVYGLLTAIPLGLFSIVDWFFSRRLEDARLATIVEFVVAVLFGVWLNTLHKRIDRFVERIVFAARHHAFVRLRNAIHALPSAERSTTVYALLTAESATVLNIASAALFIERAGGFERVADTGWGECARELEYDDPLVLFARSQGRLVRLGDFAASGAAVPPGDAAPEIAIPLFIGHSMEGVALYGKHVNGEHIDADEEERLTELVHAGGSSLTRLASIDRIRELEAQNALLLSRAVKPG